jgi:hypothetical protein
MSLFSGKSSWLYGARIGQLVRIFDLTRLEPNDTLTHREWIVSWFNQISQACHHTHKHHLYHHTIHKYSVFKILCVLISQHAPFTRLYFSALNRFISTIRMNKWPIVLLRPIRVNKCSSDKFLCFQKLLYLLPPRSQLLNSFCDWRSRMSPWLRKFPQDITYFTIGSFSPPFHTLFITVPC